VPAEQLRGVDGLREPQRLSDQLSTLLAGEIVSGRIGVGQGLAMIVRAAQATATTGLIHSACQAAGRVRVAAKRTAA